MMTVDKTLLVIALALVLGSITSALDSPCPDLFHYDSTDQRGQWTGTVTLLSDSELHGVWIRLIFDRKLTELYVDKNFERIASEDGTEYLIKNRDYLLKTDTPTNIKITVKYDGDKIPNFIGYRLNAKMVCSPEDLSLRHFEGDLMNKDFLSSFKSDEKAFDYEFDGCGTAPLSSDNEVKNGKAANGQWPWQAAIYIQKNNEEQHVCEGTLIAPEYILTAAHCVTYVKTKLVVPSHKFKIYLNKGNGDNVSTQQKLGVKKIILYPAYNADYLLNDLAVIRLDKPVIINDYVRPICLRKSSDKQEGFLVGYGINPDNKIEDLAQTKVKITSEEECSKQHPELNKLLTDNVLCASYVQDNSWCVGGSGSSLISLREGPKPVWKLKGIVTVGVTLQGKTTCDQTNTALFVNIDNYNKWINSVIS